MPYRIGYAVLLDDASHNYARQAELDISQRFQTRGGLRQSPHITVKQPFSVETLGPFAGYLDDLARETAAFPIVLSGIDFFEPKAIFIDVEENEHLRALHTKIIDHLRAEHGIEPNAAIEEKNVRFHSTLATSDLTEENFHKAKEYLKNEKPSFSFQASTLALFLHLSPEEGWIIYRRARLEK